MKKKRRLKKWVVKTIIILLFAVFLFSLHKIIIWKLNLDTNNRIKNTINDAIKIEESENSDSQEKDSVSKTYKIDFVKLKDLNSDTVAYLQVNDTNINYIVVKGKDNSYYLNHNFEKEWNVAGWIFADYHNKFDGTDKNIIIYGHNSRDGSMFGDLKKVLSKEWYANENNREIILVTEKYTYYYQVFSTYSILAEDYYINTYFENDGEFDFFVKTLKGRSVYNYDINVDSTDRILTLSSCFGDGTKRVVLHAKLERYASNE